MQKMYGWVHTGRIARGYRDNRAADGYIGARSSNGQEAGTGLPVSGQPEAGWDGGASLRPRERRFMRRATRTNLPAPKSR